MISTETASIAKHTLICFMYAERERKIPAYIEDEALEEYENDPEFKHAVDERLKEVLALHDKCSFKK